VARRNWIPVLAYSRNICWNLPYKTFSCYVNKTDLVAAHQLGTLKKKVEALVPRASFWETKFGVVPLHVIFHDPLNEAMAGVQPDQNTHLQQQAHNHHDEMFGTWTYQSDERFSFNALQRAVENLPKEIYRAKGTVRLDLDSGNYGIFHLTSRRSWLRLLDIENDEPETELVFIGKPDSASQENLREIFKRALYDANSKTEEPHMVRDLRSFIVIFA
jgi:G3E family GTPase